MRRKTSIVLVAIMLVGLFAFAGCGKEQLKLGLGIVSSYSSLKDATEDANGQGEVDGTAVAVLIDKNGKIVQMAMDVAQNKPTWTADGKFVDAESYPSKRQKGDAYGMAAHGTDRNGDGKVGEWYEQADAFIKLCIGKTSDEVKAFAGADNYGNDDVQKAGCTIHVNEFIEATVKAIANAEDTTATADMTLGLGADSQASHSNKDATEEADGLNEVDTVFVAAVKDKDGKVVVAKTDSIQGKFTFNAKGACTLDVNTAIQTKLEQGDNYNMAKFGQNQDRNGDGKVLEWYDQAAAFNKFLTGHTKSEISGFVGSDGYGVADLQTAGCTISVGSMVKAAVDAVD